MSQTIARVVVAYKWKILEIVLISMTLRAAILDSFRTMTSKDNRISLSCSLIWNLLLSYFCYADLGVSLSTYDLIVVIIVAITTSEILYMATGGDLTKITCA